jgi:NADPH-dependent 7-cyano-7-deazaguanine reductase QueF
MDADKGSESHQRAVERIFKELFFICDRGWKTILHYWKHFGEAEKDDWRKATEPVVHSLVQLASEEKGEGLYL